MEYNPTKYLLLICAGILTLIPNGFAADTLSVPAFPGAEGYGARTLSLTMSLQAGV